MRSCALERQALIFKREQLGSARGNGLVFEVNRCHFCAKQNGCHRTESNQSRKQVWRALPGVGTYHDTAKLFPRPGAAIEFPAGALYDSENNSRTITHANRNGRVSHMVLFGFAVSRIDTQMSVPSLRQWRPPHSGSVFSATSWITGTSVSPSTSVG